MTGTLILGLEWPDGLDPTLVPFATRTETVLRRRGLYDDPALFNGLTVAEVESWWNTGSSTVDDLRTTATSAIRRHHEERDLRQRLATDLEAISVEPWARHVWRHDPRVTRFLPRTDATVHEIATRGSALDRRYLFAEIDRLLAAIDAQGALDLDAAVRQYVELISGQHGERLDVLLARTSLDGRNPITLADAGQRLGVSYQRIFQLEKQLTGARDRAAPPAGIWMPQIDAAVLNGWPAGYTRAACEALATFFAR